MSLTGLLCWRLDYCYFLSFNFHFRYFLHLPSSDGDGSDYPLRLFLVDFATVDILYATGWLVIYCVSTACFLLCLSLIFLSCLFSLFCPPFFVHDGHFQVVSFFFGYRAREV